MKKKIKFCLIFRLCNSLFRSYRGDEIEGMISNFFELDWHFDIFQPTVDIKVEKRRNQCCTLWNALI